MGRFQRWLEHSRRVYQARRSAVAQRGQRPRNGPAGEEPGRFPESGQRPGPAPAEESVPDRPVDPPPPVDGTVPRSLRIGAAWSWRLIVIAVVGWGLLHLVDRFLILVAPLMIGLLLAGLLGPALRWTLKLRLPRSLATLLVLVAGLAVLGGTLTLVVNQIIQGADQMISSAEDGIRDIQVWLQGPPLNLTDADLDSAITQAREWLQGNYESLTTAGISAVTGTVQFVTGFILALVATFFFLRDGRRIWQFLVGMMPAPARAPMAYAGDGGWGTLAGYVRGVVLVAFIDAVGIGVGLWILQVPLALPLAALVFLGAFVPIVGAFVSGAVAVLVALVDKTEPGLMDGGGLVKALMVLGLVLLVQQIEGNILQPLIMSRAVKIHPLAVIVAVTAGILVGGIIGALVAVPVVAVINTMVRRLHEYHRSRPDRSAEPIDEVEEPAR